MAQAEDRIDIVTEDNKSFVDYQTYNSFESHDDLVHAANASYANKRPPPRGCFSTVQSWYYPVSDYPHPTLTEEEKAKYPRYCNGRLRKWEFITLHVLLVFLVILIIAIPIIYWVAVPAYLQHKVDRFGLDAGPPPVVSRLAVTNMTDSAINWGVKASVEKQTIFPLMGGIADMDVVVKLKIQGMELEILTVKIPGQDHWLNSQINIDCEGQIAFSSRQQDALSEALSRFSSEEGFKNVELSIQMSAPVRAYRMQLYRGIFLHREVTIPDLKADLKSIMEAMKKLFPSDSQNKDLKAALSQTLSNNATIPETEIRKLYPKEDIISLAPQFDIVWSKLELGMDNPGPRIGTALSFHNPTPLQLGEVQGVEFFISLDNTRLLHVYVDVFRLKEKLQDLSFRVHIDLIGDKLDAAKTREAIERSINKFVDTGDLTIGLTGPMKIKGANFVDRVTQDFNFKANLKDALELVAPPKKSSSVTPSTSQLVTDMLGSLDLVALLGNSTLRLNIDDKITVPVALSLPVFLAIPKTVSFPYTAGLSIFGGQQRTISAGMNAIQIQRTASAILVNTTLVVTPENTEAAANALAEAINPIVSANATKSAIGLQDIMFAAENGSTFEFAQAVFSNKSIQFALPPLTCETCLVGSALSTIASQNATSSNSSSQDLLASLPVSIRGIDVAQLNDRPGFGAQGVVDVKYPVNMPQAQLSVGYFHVDTHVEDTRMIGLELPQGLQFYPSSEGTNINGAAIVSRDPLLGEKAQRLVNAILSNEALPSYVGIVGLGFGPSAQAPVITFSKINVQLSTKLLSVLIPSSGSSASSSGLISSVTSLLPPAMVKVQSADANLKSSQELDLSIETNINNPFNISLSVGALELDTLLDDGRVVSLRVNPIQLNRGPSPLTLTPQVGIATGANGMDQKVATLVSAVLNKDTSVNMLAGVTRFSLTPANAASQDAAINQFAPVKVQVPVSTVLNAVNAQLASQSASSGPGLVDVSALLPKGSMSDLLTEFSPVIKGVHTEAAEQARLNAGADFAYSNPLPLSARFPYFAATAAIAGTPTIDLDCTGIVLQRKGGEMVPELRLGFRHNQVIPDNMASLVNNFLGGSINPGVAVGSIYFGTSASDRNDLLQLVNVDLTPFAAPLASYGPQTRDYVKGLVSSALSGESSATTNSTGQGLLSLHAPFGLVISVNGVDVSFMPQSAIDAKVDGSFGAPFVVRVDIPYLTLGLDLDQLALLNLLLGVKVDGSGPLNLGTRLAFNDVDEVATRIASITDAFIKNQQIQGSLGAGRILLGRSANDNIDAFSKISVGLPLDEIAKTAKQMTGKLTQGSTSSLLDTANALAAKVGLTVGQLGLVARSGRTLSASAAMGLNNDFHIAVHNLGYVGVSAGLDDISIVNVAIPGINLNTGRNNLNFSVDMNFPSSNTIQDKIAAFGGHLSEGVGKTPEIFSANNIGFGVSQQDHIKILSKAVLGIASSSIINNSTVNMVLDLAKKSAGDLSRNGSKITDLVSLQELSAELHPSNIIDAGLKAALKLPFPVTVELPYVDLGLTVAEHRAFDLSVQGLNVHPGENDLALQNKIMVYDTEDLANSLRDIVNAFFDKKPLPGSLGGGFAHFGVSAEDNIDSFAKLAVSLPTQTLATYAFDALGIHDGDLASQIDTSTLVKQLGLNLGKIAVQAKPQRTITASLGAGFSNNFHISLKGIGYIQGSGGIDNVELALLSSSSNITFVPGRNDLTLNADIQFPSSNDIQNKVAEFANNLLKNGLGHTTETITVSKVGFGYDAQNNFKFLNKVVIPLPSSMVINENITKMLMGQVTGGNDIKIKNDTVQLRALEAEFPPESNILAKVSAALDFPLDIAVDMPYFAAGSRIQQVEFADLGVNGFHLLGAGKNDLSLAAKVSIHDTDDLANVVAALADALLNHKEAGTLGGGRVGFGVSADDYVDTFQKVFLDVQVSQLLDVAKKIMGNATSVDQMMNPSTINRLIHSMGLTLANVEARTEPNHTLRVGAALGFSNDFNLTVKGLGYIGGSLGLDRTQFVTMAADGAQMVPGRNNLAFGAALNFPSSETIQIKLRDFVRSLLNSPGFGKTEEAFTITDAGFGHDKDHGFKFLNKAIVGIPSSTLLNPDMLKWIMGATGINSSSIPDLVKQYIPLISINSANVDGSEFSKIALDASVGIKNVSFGAALDIGYAQVGALVNGSQLADVQVRSGLKIHTEESKDLNLNIGTDLLLLDSDALEEDLAEIVDQIIHGQAVSGWVGIGGLSFGAAPDDSIDTFAKVILGVPAQTIKDFLMPLISPILDDPLGSLTKSGLGLDLQKVALDVYNETAMLTDIAAAFKGLPPTISLKMPYFGVGAQWDDQQMAFVGVSDVAFGNNSLTTQAVATLPENDALWNQVTGLAGDIIFHRKVDIHNTVSVQGITFGPSAEKSYRGFSKIRVGVPLNKPVQGAWDYSDKSRPLVLHDVQAIVDQNGIGGVITADPLPDAFGFIEFKPPRIDGAITYELGGKTFNVVKAIFDSLVLQRGQQVRTNYLLVPDVNQENGAIEPLKESLVLMLAGKDYAQHAFLSNFEITGTNGKIFSPFKNTRFHAPDLYFFKPIDVNVQLALPDPRKGVGLPFAVDLQFPNTGPLHLDLAHLNLEILDSEKKPILRAMNDDNMVIKNVHEGGNSGANPVNSKFKAWLPFRDLNTFNLIKAIRDVFRKMLGVDLRISRNNKDIWWISEMAPKLLTAEVGRNVIKNLPDVLKNVNVKILGIPIGGKKLASMMSGVEEGSDEPTFNINPNAIPSNTTVAN